MHNYQKNKIKFTVIIFYILCLYLGIRNVVRGKVINIPKTCVVGTMHIQR